jgi:hypothetical protein
MAVIEIRRAQVKLSPILSPACCLPAPERGSGGRRSMR